MAKEELVSVVYRGPSGALIAREADGDVTFTQGEEVVVARELAERLQREMLGHEIEIVASSGGVVDSDELVMVTEQGPELVVSASPSADGSDTSAVEGDPLTEG